MRTFLRLSIVIATIGCLAVTLFGLLGRWHWYPDLFNHLRPQYVLAAALLGAVSFLTKQKRTLWLNSVSLAVNLVLVLPHGLPLKSDAKPSGDRYIYKFGTLNLLYRNQNHAAVETYLRAQNADIVALQEVSMIWQQALSQRLKDVYPYQYFQPIHRHGFGLAILSKHPWTKVEVLRSRQYTSNKCLISEFTIDGTEIGLLNLHAFHPTTRYGVRNIEVQRELVEKWVATQRKAGRPLLVMGDFNCTPWSFHFDRFLKATHLQDTSRGHIFSATRHVWLPDQIMIDHIMTTPEWLFMKREVGQDVGSDHRGVFVQLQLR